MAGVPPQTAELSSIASQLEQITARVTAMAESAHAAHEDDLASELFGVERALSGARRRVERVVQPRR
jgi:methyl-accepting chemotaxis protein